MPASRRNPRRAAEVTGAGGTCRAGDPVSCPAMHRSGGPFAVFLLALALRIAYLLQIRHTPVADLLLIDSDTYHRFAGLILRGEFHGESVYSMNVLYPWFLAGIYRVFGESPDAVRWIQAGLGALNAAMVFVLTTRWFSRPAAWLAGLLAAIYPPSIFYAGALLTPVLIETFCLGVLLALAAWTARRPLRWLVVAGICLGFASLGRGNSILLVPLSLIFFRAAAGRWRHALRPWGAFAAAALSLLALASARNYVVERQFVPVSANYAAFYIGHHPRATGLYVMPEFVDTAAFEGEVLGTREAISRKVGSELTLAESSRWLFREGLRYAATHPAEELRLTLRKLHYLGNRTESPTNLNFHLAADFSPLLRLIPLQFGILVSFGVLGMALSWTRRKDLLLAYLYLSVYVITAVLFFVSAEYRMPMVPVLLAFSGHAAVTVARPAREAVRAWGADRRERARGTRGPVPRRRAHLRPLVLAGLLLPPLLIVTSVRDELLARQSLKRVDYYNLGTLYKQRGDLTGAASMLQRSLSIDPDFVLALRSLAEVEQRRGNTSEAIAHARRADALVPPAAVLPPRGLDAERVAAEAMFQRGEYGAAAERFASLGAAYAAAGDGGASISMHNNAGLCRYRMGDHAEAERIFRDVIARDPAYVRGHTNLGLVLEATGRAEEAVVAYEQALAAEPGNRKAREALNRLRAAAR